MSLLRNFDSNLIATAARQLGYHFYRSEDGKHIVTQVLGEWAGVPLFAHLSKVGADGRVYAIRVLGGRYFQPDDWPRVVGLLNEWHRNNRWPQVNLDPLPGELLACVLCEGHLHFRDGRTHQDFITNFTRNI